MHASNCVGLLLYGKQFQRIPLIEAAECYIYEHFEEVVRHEEFLSLNLHDLCSMIKNDKVKVKCESIVYNVRSSCARSAVDVRCLVQAVMQWVRHDPLNRRTELKDILPCIRVEFLDPSFLKGILDCDDFAPADMERCREYVKCAYETLTSHRYCQLPPHRAPIKPLVICMLRTCSVGYSCCSSV